MLRVNNLVGFGRARTGAGISLVGTSAGGGTTNLPAGLKENDYVVVAVCADNTEAVTPSGWDPLESFSAGARAYVFAKVMGPTPDTSIVFDSAISVSIMALRGVDTVTPMDVTRQRDANSGASPDIANPPPITPVTDGCAIMITLGLDDHNYAGSLTTPAGFGDTVASDSGSELATSAIAWQLQETAATIDPAAWGVPVDASMAVTIALRPAA